MNAVNKIDTDIIIQKLYPVVQYFNSHTIFLMMSYITTQNLLLLLYQLDQLGSGGHTQKAKPVQGVYPNPRSLRNIQSNRLRWDNKFGI